MTRDAGVPEHPNLGSATGAVLPVVTALLATISAATFIVPLASQGTAADLTLADASVSTADAGLVLGVLATLAFIGATLALAYSHAKNFDALPADRQLEFFTTHEVKEETKQAGHRKAYRDASETWYLKGQRAWQVGLYLYLLCLAALVFAHIVWFSATLALGAATLSPAVAKSLTKNTARRVLSAIALVAAALVVTAAVVL